MFYISDQMSASAPVYQPCVDANCQNSAMSSGCYSAIWNLGHWKARQPPIFGILKSTQCTLSKEVCDSIISMQYEHNITAIHPDIPNKPQYPLLWCVKSWHLGNNMLHQKAGTKHMIDSKASTPPKYIKVIIRPGEYQNIEFMKIISADPYPN